MDFLQLDLNAADFSRFSELVYRESGIHLGESKFDLLRARLSKRLRLLELDSFKDYYRRVTEDPTGEELRHMVESVTTHKTGFFREPAHFEQLGRLAAVWAGEGGNGDPVRLWSAACSTGEEAYSLAMTALESLQGRRSLKVLGTDISSRVLGHAMEGCYGPGPAVSIPQPLLSKYFVPGDGGVLRVNGALRQATFFAPLNLDGEFPFRNPFDAVFCRNVMIYFNRGTQQKVVEKLAAVLKPGGYLFTGMSESLLNIRHSLEMVAPSVYRKGTRGKA